MNTAKSSSTPLIIVIALIVAVPVFLMVVLPMLITLASLVGMLGVAAVVDSVRSGDRPDIVGAPIESAAQLPGCNTGWQSPADDTWTCDSLVTSYELPAAGPTFCEISVVDGIVTSARYDVQTSQPLEASDVELFVDRHSNNCDKRADGFTCKSYEVTVRGMDVGSTAYSAYFENR